jgi:hypothetical protein
MGHGDMKDPSPQTRQFRVGQDFAHFGGELLDVDPASIPPGWCERLVNARIGPRGMDIRERPGLTSRLSAPLTGVLVGLADEKAWSGGGADSTLGGRNTRIYFPSSVHNDADVGRAAELGRVLVLDSSLAQFLTLWRPVTAGARFFFQDTDGWVYTDEGAKVNGAAADAEIYFCRFKPAIVKADDHASGTAAYEASLERLARLAGTEAAGPLFYNQGLWSACRVGPYILVGRGGACTGAAFTDVPKVLRWDGRTFTTEYSLSDLSVVGTISTYVMPYQEGAVVVFSESSTPGGATDPTLFFARDSGGTYAALTTSATTDNNSVPRQWATYRNKLYIRMRVNGTNGRIVSYDGGSAITDERDASALGGAGTEYFVAGPVVLGAYLYYVWVDDLGGSRRYYLGRYDGTTWSDTYATIITADSEPASPAGFLVSQGSRLYFLYAPGSLTPVPKVYFANHSDLTAWALGGSYSGTFGWDTETHAAFGHAAV